MKVTLKSGAIALVDDDEPALRGREPYIWDQIATGHVVVFVDGGTALDQVIPLDHLIAQPPPGHIVKHRNHSLLDCRRENLTVVEYKPPKGMKVGLSAANKSGYRGIQHIPLTCPRRPWRAQISWGGICYHLGQFPTLDEALLWRRVTELCTFGAYCQ